MKHLGLGRDGMTILEVLIAAGIMSVLSLGFATMLTNAYKREVQLEHKQASREYRDEIDFALAAPNCGLPATLFTMMGPVIPMNSNGVPTGLKEYVIFNQPVDANGTLLGGAFCSSTLSAVGRTIGCNTAVGALKIIRAAIGPITNASSLSDIVTTGTYSPVASGYFYGEIRVHFLMPRGAQNQSALNTPVVTVSRHPVVLQTTLNPTNGTQRLVSCRTVRDLAYSKKTCEETIMNNASATWTDQNNIGSDDPSKLFTCSLEYVPEEDISARLPFLTQGNSSALNQLLESM